MGAGLTTLADLAPRGGARPARTALVVLTGIALLAGGASLTQAPAAADPDLVRVIRFMAAMKGVFAVVAFAASLWRLGRPAGSWRRPVYVAAPPAMAAGALALWAFHTPGLAAGVLHLGLFAMVAAALTDPDFLPDSVRRGAFSRVKG